MNVTARWTAFLLLSLFFAADVLFAQIAKPSIKPVQQTNNELTTISKKIDAITHQTNLSEVEKQRILSAYQAAENNLEELTAIERKTKKIQLQLQELPIKIKQLEKSIQETDEQIKNQANEELSKFSSDELNQRLVIEKTYRSALKSSINQLEALIAEQLQQPQQIRKQIAEARDALVKTEQELATLKTVKNRQERDARKSQLSSAYNKLNATLTWLDLENIIHPLRLESNDLELQFLKTKRTQLSNQIDHIDDFLTQKEQQEIDQEQIALIRAQKEAAGKHPIIQTVAQENIRYNQLLREIGIKEELYLDLTKEIEARNQQIEKDFQSAEKKIELAGIRPSLGNLLREQRRDLPLAKNYKKQIDIIHHEIAQAGVEQFQLEEAKKTLVDIDQALQARLSTEVSDRLDDSEMLQLRIELDKLLNEQKTLVFKLTTAYSEYSTILTDVDFSLQHLISLGEKFNHYLNERLLWVPSAPVINKHYLLEIYQSILWISQVSHWQQATFDLRNSINSRQALTLLGILTIGLLILFRRKIRNNLQNLLEKSRKIYADRFEFTFYSLGYVFLLALPLPMIMTLIGWLLLMNGQVAVFSHTVADGLLAAAVPLLIMQVLYLLFMPQGVVQSMFNWHEHSIQLIRRQLKWIRLVAIPVMFFIGMFADQVDSKHSYTLGRMALIIGMLAMAYILHRFAHPKKGLGKYFYQENPNSWRSRLRYLWYSSSVLIPLIIIGFAIAGYYQSALELQQKLVILLRLLFFSALLHSIVMRWLMLTNRRLALQNARKKRKLQEQADDSDKTSAGAINPEEALILDIPMINKQSKKLLDTAIFVFLVIGSGLVLRDIFPALSIFDQVVLWHHMALIDGQESLQPITLVNLFICFVYFLLMLIFVKNFPSLIDLFCAGKYSMSAGSRYAAIQLTGYTVIMITFIAIADELGGNWSKVQWLVAAMGVGLGFGLQEIFANMVSGIILLFERPIRVGDTVTVGDISGKVTRIQMRATTIVDWDQKELIVPNKMFITDKLVNWTLSDPVTRVVIPVGIAYGADEEQALRIFTQVINESPLVLKEPEPTVYFVGFGESSLDFSLRIFVSVMEDRYPAIDDIHRRIRRAFKEHNIEIPFPQRDLHIRSSVFGTETNVI
jgi:potassium-dependent mechanosensitive channel